MIFAHTLPNLRLVLLHPPDFRQRESRQRRIRRQLNQPLRSNFRGDLAALFFRSLVTPDQRRPQHFAVRIEHHQAVHLPGEPNARNFIRGNFPCSEALRHGLARGRPPVVRILLGPSAMRCGNGFVLGGRRRNHASALVDQDGARAARPHIDSQKFRSRRRQRRRLRSRHNPTSQPTKARRRIQLNSRKASRPASATPTATAKSSRCRSPPASNPAPASPSKRPPPA